MPEPAVPQLSEPLGSHWAKLSRARCHLDEIRELLSPYTGVKPYEVQSAWDAKTREWVYTAHVPDLSDGLLPVLTGSWLPVIVGDFLFNVRSALDHLAVSRAPNKRKRDASFPVVTEDIESSELNNAQLNAKEYFETATNGMDPTVIEAIRAVQPYRAVPPHRDLPDPRWSVNDHSLALLRSFQNADKHRELTVVAQGLRPRILRFVLPDGTQTYQEADLLPDDRLLRDGAVVERLSVYAHMTLEGEIEASFSTSVSSITISFRKGGRGRKSWSSALSSSGHSRSLLPHLLSETRFSTCPVFYARA